MQKTIRSVRSLALGSFVMAACADDGSGSLLEEMQPLVDAVAASGVVGVQVSASVDGRKMWAGAGVSDWTDGRAVAPGDRVRIASTTKTFMAVVVLQLVEDGTLELDETVEHWLPGLVEGHENDGEAITIRQLLQHTSGLANHVHDQVAMLNAAASAEEREAILLRAWVPEELVALAIAHEPSFPPGKGWSYTDTGYVLLGMIVEAATGETWHTLIEDRIVVPLSLHDTFVPVADPNVAGSHMRGYAQLPNTSETVDVTRVHPSALDAAGSLVSTPADVNTFFAALLGGDLLGTAVLAEMKTTVPVDETSGVGYGLGLAWVPTSCGGYYMHFGDTLGYHLRNGVSETGDRAIAVALTGDGNFENDVATLVDWAICP